MNHPPIVHLMIHHLPPIRQWPIIRLVIIDGLWIVILVRFCMFIYLYVFVFGILWVELCILLGVELYMA